MDEMTPEQREEYIWNVTEEEGWTDETLLDLILNCISTNSEVFDWVADHLESARFVWLDAEVDIEDDEE